MTQATNQAGLVSVLKQIHDDLDAAVFAAYGWPATLTDEQILERLVALNAERAAEEARGHIRWLRPKFQYPPQSRPARPSLAGDGEEVEPAVKSKRRSKSVPPPSAEGPQRTTIKPARQPWPAEQAAQTKAVQEALAAAGKALSPAEVAQRFQRARARSVEEILEALVALGLARVQRGKYSP